MHLIAFVPIRDAGRAKKFYEDRLGLTLLSNEMPFALVFDAHGTQLRLTVVQEFNTARHTILGWAVSDIASAADTLQQAGIAFTRYPGLEQDEQGIWHSPSGAKVAWFQDSEGNTLSISQQ